MPEPNARPGVLRNLRVKRVALVDNGANQDPNGDGAHIMLFKAGPALGTVHVDSPGYTHMDGAVAPDSCPADCPGCDLCDPNEIETDYEKANLDSKSRNALPDSSFAAVWTDAKGKKHRKLPIHDAGHLAAARGRVDQAKIPASVKAAAKRKIEAHTHHTNKDNKEKTVAKTIKEILKSMVAAVSEPDAAKRDALLKDASAAAEQMAEKPVHEDVAQAADLHPDHLAALKAHHAHLGKMIDSYGAGPHPDGHPVHALKAMHKAIGQTIGDQSTAGDEPGALGDLPVAKAVSKAMADLTKANTDLAAQLQIEKNIRLDREMVDVLKSFKATPFKLEGADSDVAKFRKMKEDSPEAYARTIELLKATDAQIAAGVLFAKQVGSGRTGTGSAWDQIVAKAEARVEKSDGKLTYEQAMDKVMSDNPKLVEQYRAEQQ